MRRFTHPPDAITTAFARTRRALPPRTAEGALPLAGLATGAQLEVRINCTSVKQAWPRTGKVELRTLASADGGWCEQAHVVAELFGERLVPHYATAFNRLGRDATALLPVAI